MLSYRGRISFFAIYGILLLLICSLIMADEDQLHNSSFNSLSQKEREYLENVCRNLFADYLGYTLLGVKPASWECISGTKLEIKKLKTALRVLLNQINPSRFIIKIQDFGVDTCSIVLIHKKSFLKVVKANIDLFKAVFNERFNPKSLLKKIALSEKDIYDDVGGSQSLLGIILGYGRENSLFFERRSEIFLYVQIKEASRSILHGLNSPPNYATIHLKKHTFTYCLEEKKPIPSQQFSSLEEEYENIESSKDSFANASDFLPPYFVYPISFVTKKCSETNLLRKKYTNARENLANLFKDNHFLEVVIEQLNVPESFP